MYVNNIKINIEQLIIILPLFFNDISFVMFGDRAIIFAKKNIVNSARLPKLNENLHPWLRQEVPNKSDVDMNRLFCNNVMIR